MQFSLASKEPSLITKEISKREQESGGKKKSAMRCNAKKMPTLKLREGRSEM
jgi:hypothetical protein